MNDTLIQVKGLNSFYGASHILRNIDFEVKRGETIGLMGRNGMGKSTLLKSIMGIVTPRSGDVHIKGERMNDRAIFEVAQQGIAYVPEGRGIFGNLSVVENLKMASMSCSTSIMACEGLRRSSNCTMLSASAKPIPAKGSSNNNTCGSVANVMAISS